MLKPLGVIILVLATGLAGCSSKGLRNLRSTGEGPDEFKILPTKPLTMPENYAQLPPPVPGGSNLVDRDPKGEAVAAIVGALMLFGSWMLTHLVTYTTRVFENLPTVPG